MVIKTKVYGMVKGEKRFIRKGKAFTCTRRKNGTFKTTRKWSPKRPNKKAQYKEKYQESKTGKEAKKKVVKAIEEEHWIDYEVESPKEE